MTQPQGGRAVTGWHPQTGGCPGQGEEIISNYFDMHTTGREVQSQQDCLNPSLPKNKRQRCLKTELLRPYNSGQGQGGWMLFPCCPCARTFKGGGRGKNKSLHQKLLMQTGCQGEKPLHLMHAGDLHACLSKVPAGVSARIHMAF